MQIACFHAMLSCNAFMSAQGFACMIANREQKLLGAQAAFRSVRSESQALIKLIKVVHLLVCELDQVSIQVKPYVYGFEDASLFSCKA